MAYIAWPVTVLIVGVVFIVLFRKPIERLLDRTKKIGTTGLDASTAAQETSIERTPSGAQELLARFENDLLLEQENAIRQELNNRRVDDPVERERVLVRHLAATYIYGRFERTYHLIFGSQILMLQDLNAAGILHRDNVKSHYDMACILSPEFYANYSFDQWLHYMVSQTLVLVDGDNVTITVAGREFLKFLIQEGLAFNKVG